MMKTKISLKKRIVSVVLTVLLAASALPITAFAAGGVAEVTAENGELDKTNHADLRYTEAKAATEEAEGNTEYWYCEGCGKYYSDKSAVKEITEAETVTAKLPKIEKRTQTGDSSNLILWIALLFVSVGALGGMTAYKKRKKK